MSSKIDFPLFIESMDVKIDKKKLGVIIIVIT